MFIRYVTLAFASVFAIQCAFAAHGPKALLNAGSVKPSSEQVAIEKSGEALAITIQPGKEGYPGISLKPAEGVWDLSEYGYIEAQVVNLADKPVSIGLRIDDNGSWQTDPWNAENLYLKAGQSGKGRVYFGMSFGKNAHVLKSQEIAQILVFAGKSESAQSFRIESLQAGGVPGERPPVDPNSVRTKPADGVILGKGVKVDPATQLTGNAGATASFTGDSLKVTFPAKKADASAAFKPAIGRWDLRDYLQVTVTLRNDGAAPITPRISLRSNNGATDTITAEELAPGKSAEVVVPFASKSTWNGEKTSGSKFGNDAVSAIVIASEIGDAERSLVVESVIAGVPAVQMPEWLGKRPPVEGEWTQTFSDEFDSATLDPAKWSILGENYWDKQSHFSKDNVILGDGVVRLRFEKKRGHQNDDPEHKRVTDYATGFMDSYGKWVQRYGYFEARQKLPKAPGLWPAFWMMPDRGPNAGPQWKRQDTANGGMEFDILEHLTRWGPFRYNIAMHWDGYGKDHKSTGSEKIYVQPDKDGYLTSGVLWTPGSLVFYCNGQEVARYENERVSSVPSILMFTLPMGGWDNSPLDDAKLPDDYVIDYVRVWQRKDLASDADGFIAGGAAYDGKDRK